MPSTTLHLHCFTTTATTPDVSSMHTLPAAEMLPSSAKELAKELSAFCADPLKEIATAAKYHSHKVGPHQCCSAAIRRISAPVSTVWEMVRRFDQPQTYKHFLRSCRVIAGDGGRVGCLREVHVVSGLPAGSSTEQLEVMDEENHAVGFRVVGGDHRLQNYRSVTTLHHAGAGEGEWEGTVVVESYVVDVPPGNTKEETCTFVDTIVGCNLQSLTHLAERTARSSPAIQSSTATNSSLSSSSSSTSSCKVS